MNNQITELVWWRNQAAKDADWERVAELEEEINIIQHKAMVDTLAVAGMIDNLIFVYQRHLMEKMSDPLEWVKAGYNVSFRKWAKSEARRIILGSHS